MVKNATVHNNKGDLFTSFSVEDFEVPQGRDEVWQFVPLRRLRGLHDGSFGDVASAEYAVKAEAPVTVETVGMDDARVGRTGGAVDRVGAQAYSSATSATLVSVPANTKVEEPIVVSFTGAGEGVTFGHLVIEVATGAEAVVDLRYTGSATHADNVEFVLGDAARLTVIVDASWDDDAVHASGQCAIVGRDAVLRLNTAVFGGELVRLIPRVKFTAPGGDAELLGVYFADAGQFFEQRLLVDHAVPNCRSNVLYKGALQGKDARTAWVGDVLIRANAQGTDTYEANRNLVLTEGARADAVPNLEIETGEITGAGHAATVGRFDDEQEFYLRARGIPLEEARRLIVRGFFSEVIGRIPVASIREELESRVAEELDRQLHKA
ncbi:Fe-S cluster assembly protein SufD [Corynebacterium sp. 153RC1]|uniref:Fe-S cluster assembly protein SufD n=1 Tax=unclassified Corynebacterium TaxID=2624378 RepID=UPI00211C5177|nr:MULTISPECIES: Fe-S cluster assembly protein SufD [unclassified Corynebacterium]MCQ9369737.1 Fe-S cluster assembly protein SufD [Corynebacterium sp. 35RC1]MCQ9352396.1 Fe-S cluster assembly protein SufD [Corynebacterium sp. 209RC1]MCQ9354432.1 Fe-S cluster assembly protein SufD [Corynebacterium sp. 1222RC1]MCQ9356679.1 Fe-S cluster assembly protein SufD [Corynebacterium sp. 122RC1]MCQ9358827.1 Fe-S cluster assembly protein SufD [Corynebacterium sp. 142RC1]